MDNRTNNVFDKLITLIRQLMRKSKIFKDVRYTNAELREMLIKSRQSIGNKNTDTHGQTQTDTEVRFKKRDFDVDTQLRESHNLYDFDNIFQNTIDNYANGNLNMRKIVKLGKTSNALTMLGVPDLPVYISPSVLDKVTKNKHDLTIENLREIPNAFYNPVMIFKSSSNSTNKNGKVIVTQIIDTNNKPVIIAMNIGKIIENKIEINDISSIYSKDNKNIFNKWINEGLLEYQHIKRAELFSRTNGLQLPAVSTEEINSSNTIYDNSEDVKPISKNNQGKVEQTETPQFKKWFGNSKVVDSEGKPLVVYHGSGTTFTEFNPSLTGLGNDQFGSGFYFTTDKEVADGYTTRTLNTQEKLGGSDSPNVISAFLNIQKPIKLVNNKDNNLSSVELTSNQAYKILKKAPNIMDPENSILGDFIEEYWENGPEEWMIKKLANEFNWDLLSLANDCFRDEPTAFREAVHKVLKYDGVEISFENGQKHYVAWFPNQIKSATLNNGDFDINNNDIRFSVSPAQDKKYLKAVKNGDMETAKSMLYKLANKKGVVPINKFSDKFEFNNVYEIIQSDRTLDLQNNTTMPQELIEEISTWEHVSKSPYGYSFYNKPGKSWDYTPEDCLRIADHWNFFSQFEVHCVTSSKVENNSHWTLAKYNSKTHEYDVIKTLPKEQHDTSKLDDIAGQQRELLNAKKNQFDEEHKNIPARGTVTKKEWRRSGGSYRLVSETTFEGEIVKKTAKTLTIKTDDGELISGQDFVLTNEEKKASIKSPLVYFQDGSIKSLDPVTYDDNGEVIPLSQRFNSENNDIRFSIKTQLDATQNAEVTHIGDFENSIELKNTKEVKRYILDKFQGQEFTIKSDGRLGIFPRRGLESSLKKRGEVRKTLNTLDKIVENAYPVGYELNDGQDKHLHLDGQFIYATLVELNGEQYIATIKLDDFSTDKSKAKFKDIVIEKASLYIAGRDNSSSLSETSPNYSIQQVIDFVKSKFEKNDKFSNDIPYYDNELRLSIKDYHKELNAYVSEAYPFIRTYEELYGKLTTGCIVPTAEFLGVEMTGSYIHPFFKQTRAKQLANKDKMPSSNFDELATACSDRVGHEVDTSELLDFFKDLKHEHLVSEFKSIKAEAKEFEKEQTRQAILEERTHNAGKWSELSESHLNNSAISQKNRELASNLSKAIIPLINSNSSNVDITEEVRSYLIANGFEDETKYIDLLVAEAKRLKARRSLETQNNREKEMINSLDQYVKILSENFGDNFLILYNKRFTINVICVILN